MIIEKSSNTPRGRDQDQNGGLKHDKSSGGTAMNELRSREIERLCGFAEIRVI
jgi:hypothetical protein